MLLKFKNKMMVTIEKTIAKGKEIGGIPDCLQLDPLEAMSLLREVQALMQDTTGENIVKNCMKIVSTNQDVPSIFNFTSLIDDEGVKGVMNGWKDGNYDVKFKGITLVVMERRETPERPDS